MAALRLLLQLLTTAAGPLSAADSLALRTRVEDARFAFIMDWRYQIEWDHFEPRLAAARGKTSERHFRKVENPLPRAIPLRPLPIVGEPTVPLCGLGLQVISQFRFQFSQNARYDVDQHDGLARVVRKAGESDFRTCGVIISVNQPESRLGVAWERGLSVEAMDTIRTARGRLLALLDSGTRILPGDRWIWGQRMRFLIDQGDISGASRAIRECHVEPWWCSALQGYVLDVIGDRAGAARALESSYARMPAAVRAEWDDAEYLFLYSGRTAYAALTPAARDSVNRVAWWLADPLFLDDENERHTEQLLRRVRLSLFVDHVDLWTDWRGSYMGPPLAETVLRYGWPLDPSFKPCTSGMELSALSTMGPPPAHVYGDSKSAAVIRQGPTSSWPVPWRKGDTRDRHLGCPGTLVTGYAVPQFHTMPRWSGVVDPMHLTAADYDLAPTRVEGPAWDGSWWAPEFFFRRAGAIVPLEYQVAMFRRQTNAALAAAMQWDTARYIFAPPVKVVAAAIAMKGPDAPKIGIRDTMTSARLRGMATGLASGPAVLSLEMTPREGSGTSGRARFGIVAPPPLSALERGEIALSDPVLVRASDPQEAPASLVEALARMYGTTRLQSPGRLGVFWEVYGLGDDDTVSVVVKVIRRGDNSLLCRAGVAVGVASSAVDTLVVRWTEPAPGRTPGIAEGGVAIRSRGLILNLSQLPADEYALEVTVERGPQIARSRRDFSIERR